MKKKKLPANRNKMMNKKHRLNLRKYHINANYVEKFFLMTAILFIKKANLMINVLLYFCKTLNGYLNLKKIRLN
jgi:hypothetical protein